MSGGTYFGALQQFVDQYGPYFLHNKQVGGFLQSVAATFDVALETLDLGLRASNPLRCDVADLPTIAKDRGMRLYPSETEQTRRVRLSQWRQLRKSKGTHIGQLRHAIPYFLPYAPVMRIVHQSGGATPIATWHTLLGDGTYSVHHQSPSNWNWDSQPQHWSRHWAILYAPAPFIALPRYGEGHRYGDGTLYAGASTSQIGRDIVDMLIEWKASHTALWGIILTDDVSLLDPFEAPRTSTEGWTTHPSGQWDQPMLPSGVRTRAPTAYFLYDRGVTP